MQDTPFKAAIENDGDESLPPSPVVSSAVNRKLNFKAHAAEASLEGKDQGTFYNDKYAVRWEKETRASSSSSKEKTEFKHGHVKLRIFAISLPLGKLVLTEVQGIDVVMEMLPSERCAVGVVHLYNFIVNREEKKNRHLFETLAHASIMAMYRSHLAIIANDSLEVHGRVVGNTAHEYLCRLLKIEKDRQGNAVLRYGEFLTSGRSTRYYGSSSSDQGSACGPSHTIVSHSSSHSGLKSGVEEVSLFFVLF